MGRSQRHKVAWYNFASNGELSAEGVIGPAVLRWAGDYTPPTLTSINPATKVDDNTTFTLHALGEGFTTDSVIMFWGQSQVTTFVNAGDLTCSINLAQLLPGSFPVSVRTGILNTGALTFTTTSTAQDDLALNVPEEMNALASASVGSVLHTLAPSGTPPYAASLTADGDGFFELYGLKLRTTSTLTPGDYAVAGTVTDAAGKSKHFHTLIHVGAAAAKKSTRAK